MYSVSNGKELSVVEVQVFAPGTNKVHVVRCACVLAYLAS